MPDTTRLTGAERIAAERQRQIDAEGYTPAHDARHQIGQLASAAACYATPPGGRQGRSVLAEGRGDDRGDRYVWTPDGWPWLPDDWRPSRDRVRELEKAGALIAAEIDRLLAKREADHA